MAICLGKGRPVLSFCFLCYSWSFSYFILHTSAHQMLFEVLSVEYDCFVSEFSWCSCIEKWLKNSGTCPSCKSPGRVADLRVLYAVKIIALDIAEKVRYVYFVSSQ